MQPLLPPTDKNAPAAVVLAAGRSTRMKSRLPKPLHPLCGLPLTRHVIEACRGAGIARAIVVVGHEADTVKAGLAGDGIEFALQETPRGTGDAVQAAEGLLAGHTGPIVVLAGDVPLIRPATLASLLSRHTSSGAGATLVTAFLDDAAGYGRIIRNTDGSVAAIVEDRDTTDEQKAIREWNPSIYCFQPRPLFRALKELRPNNAQGELYLTDVIGIMVAGGERVEAVSVDDSREAFGVNSRVELADAAAIMRRRILEGLMLAGVSVTDPASTYVDAAVEVGPDSTLEPQTFLLGRTKVGAGASIGPFVRIVDSQIGDDCIITASQIVESTLGDRVRVGPYCNLRPGTALGNGVKIGDFVELKNALLGENVSASHLSYIGDAEIGAGSNIGAGAITCNYDGKRKHRTVIGRSAFIGSNATLVAPIRVGDGAYVAAGSPVTVDVPDDSLVIARSRPEIKEGWARRRRET